MFPFGGRFYPRGRQASRTTAAAPIWATWNPWEKSSPVTATTAEDGGEGARRNNAYGTYLHGSLLPKNPWLTDRLILEAIRRVDDAFVLESLDDETEKAAFAAISDRVAGRG